MNSNNNPSSGHSAHNKSHSAPGDSRECIEGCGYYGTADTQYRCSLCYSRLLQSQNTAALSTPIATTTAITLTPTANIVSEQQQQQQLRKRRAQSDIEGEVSLSKVSKTNSYKEERDSPYNVLVKQPSVCGNITDNIAAETQSKVLEHHLGSSSSSSTSSEHSSVISQRSNRTPTKKPRRCLFCRRKVGLTGFDCRCGGHFCAVHRYSDKHSCTFDYQAQGQEQIKTQNPLICGSKIKKL